jgi:hypothetical protein
VASENVPQLTLVNRKRRRHNLSAPFLVRGSIEFLNHSGFVRSQLVKETSGIVKDLSLEVGMLEITEDDALAIALCCSEPPAIHPDNLFVCMLTHRCGRRYLWRSPSECGLDIDNPASLQLPVAPVGTNFLTTYILVEYI